eukprot:COSAG05_NODE_1890_length_3884_cov_26.954029_6_plen_110_part_00
MGCGASSGEGRHKGTKLTADVVTELSASPTIWVGNIPSGFGHINSLGIAMVRALTEKELVAAFSEFGEVVSVSLVRGRCLPAFALGGAPRISGGNGDRNAAAPAPATGR